MTEQKQKRGCCGDVCAVFIHGFMGSPAQFSRLAEVARAAGSQSRLITLPGHGGGVREFMRAGRSAWLAHVETELADLRAQHEKLLLVGHSMGGLLAINAAAKQPEGIAGILALALHCICGQRPMGCGSASIRFFPPARRKIRAFVLHGNCAAYRGLRFGTRRRWFRIRLDCFA